MIRGPIVFALLLASGCGQAPESRSAANDRVTVIFTDGMHGPIIDKTGETIGSVIGRPSKEGLVVAFEVSGLTPGRHAVHLHEAGRCDPPNFASSGGHWNASRHEHGTDNPRGPHDGDWDNLDVGDNGKGSTDRLITRWHGVIPREGLAMVIHANKDDELSQPDGNSGDRIACAVIIPPA